MNQTKINEAELRAKAKAAVFARRSNTGIIPNSASQEESLSTFKPEGRHQMENGNDDEYLGLGAQFQTAKGNAGRETSMPGSASKNATFSKIMNATGKSHSEKDRANFALLDEYRREAAESDKLQKEA